MEKEKLNESIKEIPALYKWLAGIVIILIISSPIIVNFLVKIDWFKDSVSGGEGDWLSFFGSYLGGILGGILTLVGVVLTIMYQDRMRKVERRDREVRSMKHIDRVMDRGYLNMAFLLRCLNDENLNDVTFRVAFNYHRNEIEAVIEKLEDLSLNAIAHKSIDDFLTVLDGFKVIQSMTSDIQFKKSTTRQELIQKLKTFDIVKPINTIIEYHSKFFESSAYQKLLIVYIKNFESSED
ncbi:hypothetical protein [Planococcus plakortidis]|uniref:hypothetical protein n=1 Tax=Planococcus plakortidis TaxID=1038856 RepID=UPI00385E1D2B